MKYAKEFVKELDELYHRRTNWLRSVLKIKKPGPPPTISRKIVDKGINKLKDLASNAFSYKLMKKEFDQHVKGKKWCLVKGRGVEEKKRQFKKWYSQKVGDPKNCIYSFWGKDQECLRFGRTIAGKGRPSGHFDKYWFPKVRRVTIWPIKNKREVPKLECLAIHAYQPPFNKIKAAKKKWTKKCPLCAILKDIEELRQIFRLR